MVIIYQLMEGNQYEGESPILTTFDKTLAEDWCNRINESTGLDIGRKNYSNNFSSDFYRVTEIIIDNPEDIAELEERLKPC